MTIPLIDRNSISFQAIGYDFRGVQKDEVVEEVLGEAQVAPRQRRRLRRLQMDGGTDQQTETKKIEVCSGRVD